MTRVTGGSLPRIAVGTSTMLGSRYTRGAPPLVGMRMARSEEHTSELQSRLHLVCRLLLEKKKKQYARTMDELGGSCLLDALCSFAALGVHSWFVNSPGPGTRAAVTARTFVPPVVQHLRRA